MDYAEEAAEYVLVRQGMTREIKKRAQDAVLHAARAKMGPRKISRVTGVPYSTVVYWILSANPPVQSKGTEMFKAPDTGRLRIHSKDVCKGRGCPFHGPSDHHMRTWPRTVRTDKYGAPVERECPHGIGHPDPDSITHLKTTLPSEDDGWGLSVHGCDGCCQPV